MSYSYERIERRGNRRQGGGGGGGGGGRTYLGYWAPMLLTATVATVGIAAWIWSERRDKGDDEGSYDPRDDRRQARPPPGYGNFGPGDPAVASGAAAAARGSGTDDASGGMMARMSGAIRRTPSPQQLLDGASKKVAAGVAAAGAAVGGALASIREEDRDDYIDHSRWSEETEARRTGGGTSQPGLDIRQGTQTLGSSTTAQYGASARSTSQHQGTAKRKTVAIVVSAETDLSAHRHDDEHHHGEASILSHLPAHIDHTTTRLFVLIYAPDLQQNPLSASTSGRPAGSLTSSFSNIGHDDAQTPGDESEKPLTSIEPNPIYSPSSGANTPRTSGLATATPAFRALYAEAQGMVEQETMILPFTTVSGHVHILRHLAPEVVYIQESLSGDNGDAVAHISGWVGQVVVVVGAEGLHGGLVDSEDDAAHEGDSGEKWWQKEERVGLGRGVEVVEGMRVGEHWSRKFGADE